jgi:hypothetical protein
LFEPVLTCPFGHYQFGETRIFIGLEGWFEILLYNLFKKYVSGQQKSSTKQRLNFLRRNPLAKARPDAIGISVTG